MQQVLASLCVLRPQVRGVLHRGPKQAQGLRRHSHGLAHALRAVQDCGDLAHKLRAVVERLVQGPQHLQGGEQANKGRRGLPRQRRILHPRGGAGHVREARAARLKSPDQEEADAREASGKAQGPQDSKGQAALLPLGSNALWPGAAASATHLATSATPATPATPRGRSMTPTAATPENEQDERQEQGDKPAEHQAWCDQFKELPRHMLWRLSPCQSDQQNAAAAGSTVLQVPVATFPVDLAPETSTAVFCRCRVSVPGHPTVLLSHPVPHTTAGAHCRGNDGKEQHGRMGAVWWR
mmetsp:Transcript_66820/g.207388  ORF Transcript_66820/g.207388 Transcript_66820/m.207388 type:complete len:296 (+) Transcript_66820:469-1356(+)